MRLLTLLMPLILFIGCAKDDRPICPSCGERATMQMHPRMSGMGIKSYYKCDNGHNFTKGGVLVDVFGEPLKKESTKDKKLKLEGVKPEETVIWEIKGEGISIIDEGKKFVRSANNPKRYCGSRSKYPIPIDKLITIRIDSESGQMFSYIGLTSDDVDVDNWSTKRPDKWCLYFSDGSIAAGIHDSEFGKSNSTDWRGGAVPIIKSSETISLIYSSARKKITFYKNKKELYVGNGFEGDLYLFGAVNYPEESISILD